MTTVVDQLLARKGRRYLAVSPETTVREAVDVFGTHDIGAVLVCDDYGLIGLLSERDCVRNLLWQRRASLQSTVRDIMREDVPAVAPSDPIELCMTVMTEQRTRHLPVVLDGQVVGVISMGDVIDALLRDRESLIESLEGYISGSPSVRPPAH